MKPTKRLSKAKADELFVRGSQHEDRGEHLSAFRLFLAGAKGGDLSSQLNAGYFYDVGLGVRRNRSKAFYWYRRAYRRGHPSAASNMGTIWRDEGKLERAMVWFHRAVSMGDDGANLEIAKYYLRHRGDPETAIHYIDNVRDSGRVSEASEEEAERLRIEAMRRSAS